MATETSGGDIYALPEECISHVLSLTTPRDACRSAMTSAAFRSAAGSDTVWARFLPPDYADILARAVEPPVAPSASKRDLFFRLCRPLLIDGGKMSFALEKESGKKCFMLSARQLMIVWGDMQHYWRWISLPESRFSEVAELLNVCWLEIRGKIEAKILSPKTTYAAYLVFKIVDDEAYGLSRPSLEASVKVGVHVDKNRVRLKAENAAANRHNTRSFRGVMRRRRGPLFFPPPPPTEDAEDASGDSGAPQARSDGWMEIELGEFYNDCGDDGEVDMSLMEVKGGHWKSGLIVHGIEVRPKKK